MKNAQYAAQDAQENGEEILKEAGRKEEDAEAPEKADSTEKILKLQLEQIKAELLKYETIRKADGDVKGDLEGTVTAVNLSVGERTPDGAAVVCADSSEACRFEAALTKEQKKYVNQGDEVTIKLGKRKQQLKVDYLAEDESSPLAYRAVVYLPKQDASLGMSGTMVRSVSSEIYACCIPVDALYSENNGARFYVYTVGERDGILGKELYVDKRVVKVLEQNEEYAALEPGMLSSEDMVITVSDKEIRANDVIRHKDPAPDDYR